MLHSYTTFDDVKAKYGEPYRVWDNGQQVRAIWRMDPEVSVDKDCPLGPNCVRCLQRWERYLFAFTKPSRILYKIWWIGREDEDLGIIRLEGYTGKQCWDKYKCWEYVNDLCKQRSWRQRGVKNGQDISPSQEMLDRLFK